MPEDWTGSAKSSIQPCPVSVRPPSRGHSQPDRRRTTGYGGLPFTEVVFGIDNDRFGRCTAISVNFYPALDIADVAV